MQCSGPGEGRASFLPTQKVHRKEAAWSPWPDQNRHPGLRRAKKPLQHFDCGDIFSSFHVCKPLRVFSVSITKCLSLLYKISNYISPLSSSKRPNFVPISEDHKLIQACFIGSSLFLLLANDCLGME